MLRKNNKPSIRTCLYTNKKMERHELIRLVKVGDKLVVDSTLKMHGRGYWFKPSFNALKDHKILIILSKKTKTNNTNDLLKELKKYEKSN